MKTAPKRARRGFTLIEILVVIGIILILLGMVVLGFRHLDAVASKRDTIAELHVCRDLLTEYEKLNGNANIVAVVYPPMGAVPRSVLLTDVQVGGASDMSDRSQNTGVRYNSRAVKNTRVVMQSFLMRVPRNRTMVSSLPTKRIPLLTGLMASGKLLGYRIRLPKRTQPSPQLRWCRASSKGYSART